MIRQGIILLGGSGSRLAPYTNFINKSLVGINGKFIVDYSLNILKKLGVKDLIVVLGGDHFADIVSYIKDGKDLEFNSVSYIYQREAAGLSQAINLCANLIIDEKFLVILGDNIFDGDIKIDDINKYEAQIVLKSTKELNRFGVASIKEGKINHIVEKPKQIDTNYDNYAITGLYIFDQQFFTFFKQTVKSDRGEYEITNIMNKYLEQGSLGFTVFDGLWKDAGTHDSIKELSDYFWNKNNGKTQANIKD